MKNLLTIFSAFILMLLSAFAQTDTLNLEDEIKTELDTVVIEATRSGIHDLDLPLNTDFINAKTMLRGEQGISLDEFLFSDPAVAVDNRFNPSLGDRISIRGIGSRASFGVRGIRILLDNIPLTMPDGQSQLNNIDFGSMGSIEVIRGPSSSLYGNASGGVINIKTESPSKLPFSFQPKFTTGSFKYKKYEGKISGSFEKYSYLVNLSKLNYDGYREHSAVSSYSVNSVIGTSFSTSAELKWIFNYYNSPYALNPSSLDKETAETSPRIAREFVKQQGAGQRTTQWQTGLSLTLSPNNDSKLETSVYFISRNILNPIPGRIIDLKRKAGGIRSSYNHFFDTKDFDLNLTLGFDIETQFDKRSEYNNNGLPDGSYALFSYSDIFDKIMFGNELLKQDESVTGFSPFVQGEITISSLSFLLGLRYDNYRFKVNDKFFDDGKDDSGKRVMDKVSPVAGINYRIGNLTKLYFNYSTSFQTPTTAELSNRPDGAGGFNPNLLPGDIYSFELSFKRIGLFNYLNLDASFFYLRFSNILIAYQVPGNEQVFYNNAGEASNTGIELNVEFFPTNDMNIFLSYAGYDFVFKDYLVETEVSGENQTVQLRGNSVPGVPSNRIAAGVNYNPDSGLFGSAKLIWDDKYFTNDFNGSPPGIPLPQSDFINNSHVKIDLRLGYLLETNFTDVEISFGVNNIFNERYNSSVVPNATAYRFYEPAPGRNWYGGIKVILPSN